jgi:hypothetical protein
VSSVLGTEVPALNGTCETFTFRGASYVNFFNVSKQFNANALTYSELFAFSQAEFPQTTASFYAALAKWPASGLVTRLAFLAPVVT